MADRKKDNRADINREDINIEDTSKLLTESGSSRTRKKLVIIALAVIAVLAVAGIFGSKLLKDRKYDARVALAEAALLEGDYARAEEEYLAAIEMNERRVEAREGLAYTYIREGKDDEAAELYKELYDETGDEKYEPAPGDILPNDPSLIPGVIRENPDTGTWMEIGLDEAPESDALYGFLQRYYAFLGSDELQYDFSSYDSRNASESMLLDRLAGDDPVSFESYPYSEDYYLDDRSRPDPRGWCEYYSVDGAYNTFYYYTAKRAECVDWIAKNIFYATDDDIAGMLSRGEGEKHFYLEDGYYYFTAGIRTGIGIFEGEIVSVRTNGTMYYVEYQEQYIGTRYALMEHVTIDDADYWTMHWSGLEPLEDASGFRAPDAEEAAGADAEEDAD